MEKKQESNLIVDGLRRISPQIWAAFCGAMFFGLFAHGMGLLNKFSHHEDVNSLFDFGLTVSSGRWTLQIFKWLEEQVFGTPNTSLPLYNGIISLLCVGVVCGLLVHLLKIRNTLYCALTGAIMSAFPVITVLFAYMYTSHVYMIGLVMLTVSAVLICQDTPWWVRLFAVCLGGAAVGIYQVFLSNFLTTILIYDIMILTRTNRINRDFWKRIGSQLICILSTMFVYLAGNQFFLHKYHMELSAYQGIDEMGRLTMQELLNRTGALYREFFNPTQQVFHDMYPGTLHLVYKLTLVMEGVLVFRLIWLTWRKDKGQAVVMAMLFALIPLGCNFIYIMGGSVHGLMVYGQVMQVVLFAFLFDQLELPGIRVNQVLSLVASIVLMCMAVMYARYDNQCYLKDALHQQEAISYFTTLITRIKSQTGYRPEMEVHFTNTIDAEKLAELDPTAYNIDELDYIRINPYWHNFMEYTHVWSRADFMRVWCGADFTWNIDESLRERPEVLAMPAYPADGSIQIIDDVVVVKFY